VDLKPESELDPNLGVEGSDWFSETNLAKAANLAADENIGLLRYDIGLTTYAITEKKKGKRLRN
jgi:hypothetical protein